MLGKPVQGLELKTFVVQAQATLLLWLLSFELFAPLAWCFHQEIQTMWLRGISSIKRPPNTELSALGKIFTATNVLGKVFWSLGAP
jgi:hypothetical protein